MGLSRNKVAVPEGAAGSPPFYGVFRTPVWCLLCASFVHDGRGCRGGCWCGRDHGLRTVGPGSGMGMLLGSRTATAPVVVWRGPARRRGLAGFPVGRVRRARGGLRTG